MLIHDYGRNNVIHLVVERRRDGQLRGGYSRNKIGNKIDKKVS